MSAKALQEVPPGGPALEGNRPHYGGAEEKSEAHRQARYLNINEF